MPSKEEIVLRTVIETIPQWYFGNSGPQVHTFTHNLFSVKFCSHRPLTPHLNALRAFAESKFTEWTDNMPATPTPSAIGKVREDMALFWISRHVPFVKWDKLLAYAEWLRFRTYENQPISRNLVLSDAIGGFDITESLSQKIIDPLASSQNVYFRIDGQLRFIGYEQIAWASTNDPEEYKFNPDFVQPFISVLNDNEASFHLTSRGDILIIKKYGMLASYRKGHWYIYDTPTLKNSITDIMDSYRVGCNLFDVVFDLSYRRHGALLVYDPMHLVIEHIVNKSSVILAGKGAPDDVRQMLTPTMGAIKMGASNYEVRKKKLFLEVACIDGAVIFDDNAILAFGAMIETHTNAGGHAGARTTAARSAYLWGGMPVKVSSDGDISMIFKSKSIGGVEEDAELTFM